ncbi:O-succinylbenzoic acid--CoA ligase [Paramicrobacterium humi]|uniref:O-succinylbenzoic acid--CoA ligase n=1 Tax=Paramicrobacterium humi TaxID=640635 RepID=A0A1H4JPI5_9MICO|nr:AMP-binding protein [Microbacterium humi]SEB47648.1 O-succinylbenzoic acid--CoA ligase [Microbacterium humi]
MTRNLVAVAAAEPLHLMHALRGALDRSGPAVLPLRAGAERSANGLEIGADIDLPEAPQATAVVIQTSGSSGVPKNVSLSCDALLASASASESVMGGPGQWLLALPAHYVAGLQVLVRSLAADTTPVVLPPGHFDVAAFVAASRELTGELRFTSLVPTQLMQLLETRVGVAALRRFDGILVGGQAVPFAVRDRIELLGLPVFRTYGSSETAGGCVYSGRALPGVEIGIVDGQVELTGPMLADGYLSGDGTIDRELTDDVFVERHGQRWYRTGDLGELVDGVLHVLGRADNVIISGGINVNLDRIERIVRGIRGLEEAVVVGAQHERWGEVPVVVVASDASARLDQVRDAVGEALGAPSRPDRIVVIGSIPVLPSGKPDRQALTRAVATHPES